MFFEMWWMSLYLKHVSDADFNWRTEQPNKEKVWNLKTEGRSGDFSGAWVPSKYKKRLITSVFAPTERSDSQTFPGY